MSRRPLVSVIVVTLERLELLLAAVESLVRQTYSELEIIVVDNGSVIERDIGAKLQQRHPQVKCLRLESNLGFAGGNNCGIGIATGDYIALLNNDAVADTNWIAAMVAVAEADPAIGAVASVVRDGNVAGTLDSCGVGVAIDGMSRQLLHGEAETAAPGTVQELLAVSGCACLFRKTALDQAGLLDEHFFSYCEDTDLSLRVINAGWRIVLAPEARITHFYSRTSGPYSIKKVFWIERNHYWVAVKNFHWLLVVLLPLFTCGRYGIQAFGLFRGNSAVSGFVDAGGSVNVIKTLLRANVMMWLGLPHALKDRWSRRAATRNTWTGFAQFMKHRMGLTEIILGRVVGRSGTSRRERA